MRPELNEFLVDLTIEALNVVDSHISDGKDDLRDVIFALSTGRIEVAESEILDITSFISNKISFLNSQKAV